MGDALAKKSWNFQALLKLRGGSQNTDNLSIADFPHIWCILTWVRNFWGQFRRNTSIWVLTSFVFLTSFRFMSSFAFLNFFVGLTSLDFELFWCLMLFVLFCCLTYLVLYTLSKTCARLLTFSCRKIFVPFYFCFQVHSVFMFCVFMELFQILLWHHFSTLILIGRTPWGEGWC